MCVLNSQSTVRKGGNVIFSLSKKQKINGGKEIFNVGDEYICSLAKHHPYGENRSFEGASLGRIIWVLHLGVSCCYS